MMDSYNVGYSVDALGDLREIYSYINRNGAFGVKTRAPFLYRFSDWKYNNLKAHFLYKKADIPVIRIVLTNSDGTPVDTITILIYKL